jgi:glycosyltransferase involved in cell wall biosynthesis
VRIVLAHSHANTFGGGERAVLELARELSQRHEVRLMLGGYAPTRTFADLASFQTERVGRLAWPTRHVNADAIVTNSFGANLLASRNAARVAYWAHSTRSVFLQGGRRVDLALRRLVDYVAVRRTAILIANSHFAAAKLQRLYNRPADAVVYPGVDLALFQPGSAANKYAVTVGRLAPEKGLERLFDLWRELPELPLRVIGAGEHEYVLALKQRAPAGVEFRGQLEPGQVAEAYRSAAVAVFAPLLRSSVSRRLKPWRAECQSSPGAREAWLKPSWTVRRAISSRTR